MDEIALYEIQQAINRAKARMRRSALVCKDCGKQMYVDDSCASCFVCKTVYLMKPKGKPWI